MPGAPCVWVADTFSNLSANILPAVLEGLERKGFREGVHYIVEKEPPTFTDREKENLPDWLKPHFWKPFNRLVSYKRTIIFFTGMNIRFGSLDRPSTLAGASYVYVFGDEAKYFKEEKISNLMKAVRGYRAQYGTSVFYRGCSFTTDMPDTSHVGEDDWIPSRVCQHGRRHPAYRHQDRPCRQRSASRVRRRQGRVPSQQDRREPHLLPQQVARRQLVAGALERAAPARQSLYPLHTGVQLRQR